MAAPLQPAASPSPPRPPPPLPLPPPPPLPHHDTTLTLALALPPPPFACAISPRPLQARRPRPDSGAASPAFARVRSSPTGDTPPCSECGKRFPSWKALFGHMRCHPERQWRGITPPPHFRLHQAVGGAPTGPLAAAAAAEEFTVQEREIATSLLMLAGARPGGAAKGRKSNLAPPSSVAKKESCGATPSSSSPAAAAAPPPKCDDHKCSVCARGFATGQALGGHKRCHWERACAEGMAVATPSSYGSAVATSQAAAAAATTLDLNLPPPGTTILPRKSDEDATLDLKLGY